MKAISLTIPYLVVSTQQHRDGRHQVHARTPFGCIDIASKLITGVQNTPLFDVAVEGDLDSWALDHTMPREFRNALFELAGKIAVHHSGWPVMKHCRLAIHFKGKSGYISVAGYLSLAEFNWRIKPDETRTMAEDGLNLSA